MTISELKPKERTALKITADLLVEHGLGDWHINMKDVKSYHAQTRYKPKMIMINSRFIVVATKEHFVGVIYHEIAHALVGGKAKHGWEFKRKVYELTGSYKYAGYGSDSNIGDFLTHCPRCKATGSTSDNTRTLFCRKCRVYRGVTSRIVIEPNPFKEEIWV